MKITLKAARHLMGLKQTEVRVKAGISQSQVSKAENGLIVSEQTYNAINKLFCDWRTAEIKRLETRIAELRRYKIESLTEDADSIQQRVQADSSTPNSLT